MSRHARLVYDSLRAAMAIMHCSGISASRTASRLTHANRCQVGQLAHFNARWKIAPESVGMAWHQLHTQQQFFSQAIHQSVMPCKANPVGVSSVQDTVYGGAETRFRYICGSIYDDLTKCWVANTFLPMGETVALCAVLGDLHQWFYRFEIANV